MKSYTNDVVLIERGICSKCMRQWYKLVGYFPNPENE